jgi:hypothetical protein
MFLFNRTAGVIKKLSIAVFIAVVFSSIADSKTRKATPDQVNLYREVKKVITGSITAGPEGWKESEDNFPEPDENYPNGDFPYQFIYKVEWNDNARQDAAKDAIQKALIEYGTKSKREREKLVEKSDKLSKEIAKAAVNKDYKAIEKLNLEGEELTKKSQELTNGQNNIIQKMSPHDVRVTVIFWINSFWFTKYGLQDEPVSGNQAFREKGKYFEESGWNEGITYVLIGKKWKVKSSGVGKSFDVTGESSVSYNTVQSVMVSVQADPQRTRSILAKIDWNALKRLIKN